MLTHNSDYVYVEDSVFELFVLFNDSLIHVVPCVINSNGTFPPNIFSLHVVHNGSTW